MSRNTVLLAVVGSLSFIGSVVARPISVKPDQIVDTICDQIVILGTNQNGRRIFCFDGWTVTQIDLGSEKRNKSMPLPKEFRGVCIHTAAQVNDSVWLLAISRNKKNDVNTRENRMMLFDFEANKVKANLESQPDLDTNLLIAPRQQWIVETTLYGYKGRIRDLKSGKEISELDLIRELSIKELPERQQALKRCCLDPSSAFLAFGLDGGMVSVWDIQNKKWHRVIPQQKDIMLGALTFIDQFTLAGLWYNSTTGKESLKIYDWKAGKLLFCANTKGSFPVISASPDGHLLAFGDTDANRDNSFVRFWDVRKKTEIASFKASEGNLDQIIFTKDGKKLITHDQDGKIKVWSVRSIVSSPMN